MTSLGPISTSRELPLPGPWAWHAVPTCNSRPRRINGQRPRGAVPFFDFLRYSPRMNLSDSKADSRLKARHRRRTAHAEGGQDAARGVVEQGLAAVADIRGAAPAGIVAGYLAVGSELDADPLLAALEKRGWSLALPVVKAPRTPLVFRRWRRGQPMDEGSFGIAQPRDDAPDVRPDVVLAPLLAFDDDGYRLGQGGGFYDRTLEKWRAAGHMVPVLGLAFAAQRIDAVPRDQYDQRLDGIVTEHGWRRYGDTRT